MIDMNELKPKIMLEGLHNEAVSICCKIEDLTKSMINSSLEFRQYIKYIEVVSFHLENLKIINNELKQYPIKKKN